MEKKLKYSRVAIASLTCSIAGWIFFPLAFVSFYLGCKALKKIEASQTEINPQKGNGLAWAGITISGTSIFLMFVFSQKGDLSFESVMTVSLALLMVFGIFKIKQHALKLGKEKERLESNPTSPKDNETHLRS